MSSMMHVVKFKMAATAASQINGWVSNATGNMIKDIISPESITPGEKMMALNVVYFKGELFSFFLGGEGRQGAIETAFRLP
jgi:serine protease inhibitor